MKKILVTGSAGLVGSDVAAFFHEQGFVVHGIDNNQRAVFFGSAGDTSWMQKNLSANLPRYRHHSIDIRDRAYLMSLVKELRPDAIVHAAAQPSHDLSAQIPFDDFDVNAVGTMNLLEAARRYCPEAPFVFLSSNKVYGDLPNTIPLEELETRWDYADPTFSHGIPETLSIDQSTHSPFGASKAAADIMVQEYGRYFNMPTCCLRAGCITGPNHAGVELHGFLSYLVRCNLEERDYTIFGYKGKQVRDNIHSEDVASFIHAFVAAPRCGEVYNIGGGKENSCSVLEAIGLIETATGKKHKFRYDSAGRKGDHICYYSDLRKIQSHYPVWHISKSLNTVIQEIVVFWDRRRNIKE